MMKIRRYLRGSGRVLAFVFIASVIWLLFDMAALRISINDVNSQLLKEQVIKEREIFKQQSKVTQLMKRGFKHPVQRVDLAVTHVGKGTLSSSVKLAQVYRQGGKKQDQMLGDTKQSHLKQAGDKLLKTDHLKSVVSKHNEGAALQNEGVPAKKAVHLDLNGPKLEKSGVIDGSNKVTSPVVPSNKTQVPPGVQGNKPIKTGDAVQHSLDKKDLKAKVKDEQKTKTGSKVSQLQAEGAHPVKTTPSNKDVKAKEVDIKNEKKQVRKFVKSEVTAAKQPPKPTIKLPAGKDSKDNFTAIRKPGVHKVLSLDLTHAPRDANAVGQFGQSVIVASDEDAEVKKRWDEGHFNVYLSDQIPVDRAIPDTRPEM